MEYKRVNESQRDACRSRIEADSLAVDVCSREEKGRVGGSRERCV